MAVGGNTLFGEAGRDELDAWQSDYSELYGGAGNDTLRAGSGGSRLDGGKGADVMTGGAGADYYVIDNARDQIIETYIPFFDNNPNPRDTVRSSISWTLSSNLEDLQLVGKARIDGIGNSLSNKVTGNSKANTLDGGGGNDTLHGLRGNDKLWGGSGKDELDGGAGNDLLTGGRGNDVFIFTSSQFGRDRITDFTNGSDRISLSGSDLTYSSFQKSRSDGDTILSLQRPRINLSSWRVSRRVG